VHGESTKNYLVALVYPNKESVLKWGVEAKEESDDFETLIT